MSKPLNLDSVDRIGCVVTYNLNRFEVFHAAGWLMFAATTKDFLKQQLSQNGIVGAQFSKMAQLHYQNAK